MVEVALAIGIVAFAFVALMALLPAGNTAFRRAVDIAVCGQIAQRVIGDAEESDFDNLIDTADANGTDDPNFTFRAPGRNNHALRYFDDQGRELVAANASLTASGTLTPQQQAQMVYQVNTRIMPRLLLPENSNAPKPTALDPKYEAMALVTVQVAHNPSNVTLPFSQADGSSTDPTRNLWKLDATKAGIDIFTYSAVIGRSQ